MSEQFLNGTSAQYRLYSATQISDSFVEHFSSYKKAQGQLGRVVQILGWSGAHVTTLWQCTELTCRRWTQHVVVMQIGSNDLRNTASMSEHIVDDFSQSVDRTFSW